ncbi:DNA gyrase subunit B [Corallococcus sp. H22C18031201]|nr:DNA gyrase subunit B [Corallococcus sp. H22C18031201]
MNPKPGLTFLESVRHRPGMYVGDIREYGLHHLVYFLMNALFDEARGGAHRDVVLEVGEDASSVSFFCTEAGVSPAGLSARIESGSHSPSSAVGFWNHALPIVCALSSRFQVDLWTEEAQWRLGSVNGEAPSPGVLLEARTPAPVEHSRGMCVMFTPDASIFESTVFDAERLFRRCHELAVLVPGTRVRFIHRPSGRDESLCYPGGLGQWASELSAGLQPMHPEPLVFDVTWDGLRVRCALQWCESDGRVESFANTVKTRRHGVHVDGVFRALRSALIHLTGSTRGFTPTRLSRGLIAVISVEGDEQRMKFAGPTKELLAIKRLDKGVRNLLRPRLIEALRDHPVLSHLKMLTTLPADSM